MHCQPCREQDKTSEACYWCQDCSEALCDTCFTSHKAFKVSKNHIVTRYEDHKKQSGSNSSTSDEPIIVNDFSFCGDHPDKPLKYFCKSHEKPVCLICKRKYHREDCDVENIEDVITETSINLISEKIISNIDEQIASFNETTSQKEDELTRDDRIFETALSSLKETREQINAHLDELENDVRQKIETQRDVKLSLIRKDVHSLAASVETLSNYKMDVQSELKDKNINATKRYMQLKNIERNCKYGLSHPNQSKTNRDNSNAIGDILPILTYNKTASGIEVTINKADNLENKGAQITMESLEVGSSVVELEELAERNLDLGDNSVSTPQATSNTSAAREEDVSSKRFIHKFSFYIEGCNKKTKIADLKLMPNKLDLAIAVLSQQRVLLYTKFGQKKGHLNVGGDVDSIAVIDPHTIAVSMCHRYQIVTINTDSMVRIHTINTGEPVKGLVYHNGNLLVNLCDTGLSCMTPYGKRIWNYKGLKGYLYFYLDKNGNLFSASLDAKSIYVYNILTKRRSTYFLKGLECPMGMVKDKDGNLLVSCEENSKIFVKSSIHASAVVLLDSYDGIKNPVSLDYDDLNDELIVVNGQGDGCINIFALA